ncbi:unnamed protein product [Toxocara canis]|uniref:Transposase n=1 Tax=Toxocara canis TaxID=6265 RepID=A0A183TW76_TOXCA|nr:unnamed protein product [Toxocara canis]
MTKEIDEVIKSAQERETLEYTLPAGPDGQTYRAFRKVFYGHFRWVVASFDREPGMRIGKNCSKTLL